MLRFRHYNNKITQANPSFGFNFWGWKIKHPSLDICFGKHVFVIFWDNKW